MAGAPNSRQKLSAKSRDLWSAGVCTRMPGVAATAASGEAARSTAGVRCVRVTTGIRFNFVDAGTRLWCDGSRYDGEWREDVRQGRGVCVYAVDGGCEGQCTDDCARVFGFDWQGSRDTQFIRLHMECRRRVRRLHGGQHAAWRMYVHILQRPTPGVPVDTRPLL
jgi:hypothetical protein